MATNNLHLFRPLQHFIVIFFVILECANLNSVGKKFLNQIVSISSIIFIPFSNFSRVVELSQARWVNLILEVRYVASKVESYGSESVERTITISVNPAN